VKPETEVYVVAALDNMVTKLDQVLDELEEISGAPARKAENLIFGITLELNGLMDRLTEEGYEKSGSHD
jgi:hypothetical protein